MAKIFYSMAGEGRGHAVRVRTLVEQLRREHELTLFAPGDAFEFLEPSYGRRACENVELIRIQGVKFRYTGGKLDLLKSTLGAGEFAGRRLPELVDALRRRMDAVQPDLAIADFEPALPRAARITGLPWMSLDHQHVLLAYDLQCLPRTLQRYAWWMSWAIRWYYGWGGYSAVASSFYSPPLRPGFEDVLQIGPLLRPEIMAAKPQTGSYLLCYLRPNTPPHVIQALQECGWPVRIYGMGERPSERSVSYHAIHEHRFVRDLAGCAALMSAAGNQLLGEALYFRKPVFALPESMHHEQQINAHFLKAMGGGEWTTIETFDRNHMTTFLSRLDEYRDRLQAMDLDLDATNDALTAIESQLQRSPATPESLLVEAK